jgi:DNA modification methylase
VPRHFLYSGNAYNVLDRLAPHSINVCYTSPTPAFFASLRGTKEEWVVGAEEDTMSYVEHMVKIMEKVKRVLKPDGSLWLNMADYTRTKDGALIQVPEMTSLTLQQSRWHLISTLIWSRHDDLIRILTTEGDL